jgi:tetratricopeptide (TPR) repeat protein
MQQTNFYEALDAEELFKLGLNASNAGDAAGALNLLKLAVERDKAHARAAWLLGAEYAQIGMMDRAQVALTRAVELEPGLVGARFQLGLLRLTQGDVEAARGVWQALDAESENSPYRLFRDGMLLMVVDAFEPALDALRRCAALPQIDAALKRDVDMVIGQIETRQISSDATTAAQPQPVSEEDSASLLFLSAYRNNTST